MSVKLETESTSKVSKLQRNEEENLLKIGRILFCEGIDLTEFTNIYGDTTLFPEWDYKCLNPFQIEKIMGEEPLQLEDIFRIEGAAVLHKGELDSIRSTKPEILEGLRIIPLNSDVFFVVGEDEQSRSVTKDTQKKSKTVTDVTIKIHCEKGAAQGLFAKRKGPNNSNEFCLTPMGVYWLFGRKVIGIMDFATFLDREEYNLAKFYKMRAEQKKNEIPAEQMQKIQQEISVLERIAKARRGLRAVYHLSEGDRHRFEKDLRAVASSLFIQFRYGLIPPCAENKIEWLDMFSHLFSELLYLHPAVRGDRKVLEPQYRIAVSFPLKNDKRDPPSAVGAESSSKEVKG